MMQTIALDDANNSFVCYKPFVCNIQINSFVAYKAMVSNLISVYFHFRKRKPLPCKILITFRLNSDFRITNAYIRSMRIAKSARIKNK